MNRSMIAFGAASAVLTLGGCSSADSSTTPTPSSSISSSPEVTPTATTPAPSASSPGVPSASAGTLSLVKSCQAAVKDQRGALAQLQAYVKNPLKGGVTAQEIDQTRQQLQADAEAAPAPLKEELRTQVGVLDEAVKGIRTKNVKNVDVAALQAAQARVAAICDASGK